MSSLYSKVCEMKLLNAAHRFERDALPSSPPSEASDKGCRPDICARFFANLSRSVLSSFSFLLSAPWRLFKLLRRITFTCSVALDPATALPSSVSSGNASTSSSNVVTSFLFGLLRRCFSAMGLSILDRSLSCLILRLSCFVAANNGPRSRESTADLGRCCWFFLGIDLSGFWVVVTGCLGGRIGACQGFHQMLSHICVRFGTRRDGPFCYHPLPAHVH